MHAIVTAIVFFKQRTVCIINVGAVRKSCQSRIKTVLPIEKSETNLEL